MSNSNNHRFYDLNFTQKEDGSIRLTQSDCGEDSIIDAHLEQLTFITRRLCGMPEATAAQVQDLERKLEVLADKIGGFVCMHSIREEILECCGNGIEFMVRLDALYDLALEFTGGLAPESALSASPQPVRNVSASKADKTPVFELEMGARE